MYKSGTQMLKIEIYPSRVLREEYEFSEGKEKEGIKTQHVQGHRGKRTRH